MKMKSMVTDKGTVYLSQTASGEFVLSMKGRQKFWYNKDTQVCIDSMSDLSQFENLVYFYLTVSREAV